MVSTFVCCMAADPQQARLWVQSTYLSPQFCPNSVHFLFSSLCCCRSTAGKAVGAVDVPESVIDVLTSLRDYLQDKCEPPIYVSDRRFMKALNMLQVAAYADGRDEVSIAFCMHAVATLCCMLAAVTLCCMLAMATLQAFVYILQRCNCAEFCRCHCLHALHVTGWVMIDVAEGSLSGNADMHLMPVGLVSDSLIHHCLHRWL